MLISSLCQRHVEWDRVVEWLDIDEQSLRVDLQSQAVFNFMAGRREWYKLTSTQLADHIFRNYEFDDAVLVDVYTSIVRETAFSANDARSGFDSRENLKELMKFRFLTRIFGDRSTGLAPIEAIYQRLSAVPRIRNNDQFWLQFAMSSIEQEDIGNAERYIETALGLAAKRGAHYSTHQILDQRARVLLLKQVKQKGPPNTVEIETAIDDLNQTLGSRSTVEKIHPLRAARYVLRLVEEKIDNLSQPLRGRLLVTLETMRDLLINEKLSKTAKGEVESLKKMVNAAILVLKNA